MGHNIRKFPAHAARIGYALQTARENERVMLDSPTIVTTPEDNHVTAEWGGVLRAEVSLQTNPQVVGSIG